MKTIIKLVIVCLFSSMILCCTDKDTIKISSIIPVVEAKPDTALMMLDSINQIKLSDKSYALYSFVYTMAQDKAGYDIDNDSLIRVAYNWYRNKPNDSLYAKCLYYMGLYYAQNDSTEKALVCFSNANIVARTRHDYYTQSLALYQTSIIQRDYAPRRAIRSAKDAISLYNKVGKITLSNEAYSVLNLADCIAYNQSENDNISKAIITANKALALAWESKDSSVIADTYQDLSLFHSILEQPSQALSCAKLSWRYRSRKDNSAKVALANAYLTSDSPSKAKEIIMSIRKKDYRKNGSSLYSLLRFIAFKEKDYVSANRYADSTEIYLKEENSANLKDKDSYYSSLIQKDNARRARMEKAKQIQNVIMLAIIIVVFLIGTLILHYARMEKKQLLLKLRHQQDSYLMQMEHKERQLAMMKNFLMRKIDILQKLNKLKSEDKRSIILNEEDWNELEIFLNSTYDGFVVRLYQQFSRLTKKDVHFLMLIKAGLSYSSIAMAYNIEAKSVKQKLFLLKEKLGLKGSKISTYEFINEF